MHSRRLHHAVNDGILIFNAKVGFQSLIAFDVDAAVIGAAKVNGNTVRLLMAQRPEHSFTVA